MPREDLRDFQTFVKTSDGTLWSTNMTTDSLSDLIRRWDNGDLNAETEPAIQVRGPLHAEGWKDKRWLVPLWSIIAFSGKP